MVDVAPPEYLSIRSIDVAQQLIDDTTSDLARLWSNSEDRQALN